MYEQPFNPYAANLEVVKGYFKQTKVLVMGILYIISAVIGVITAFVTTGNIGSYINDGINLLEKLGFDTSSLNTSEIDSAISSSSVVSTLPSVIVSAAITCLLAAGFIIMYVKSRNESPDSTPSAGISILYVMAMISMILTIIGTVGVVLLILLAFFLVGSISGTSGTYDLGNGYQLNVDGSTLSVLIIIVGIIALLVMVYMLLFTINRKRFYGSVKQSINSVELQNRGAKPFGVILVINAVFTGFSVISAIFSLVNIGSLGLSSGLIITALLSLISSVVNFAMLICEAKIALGYKKYIDEMKYGYNGAPYNGVQGGYRPTPNAGAPQAPYGAPRQSAPYSGAAPQQPAVPAVCPRCGAPTDGSSHFCENCGAKL